MDNHDKHPFDWNDIYTGDVSDCHPPDELILDIVDGLEPGTALDVGCGAGGLVLELVQRGWKVTGVDIASKAITAARKALSARGLEAELVVHDAANWKPVGTFDLVTNCFALPGTKAEQEAVYRMIRGALAPGGTVLLKDFNAAMTTHEVFSTFYCPSVEELLVAFDGLEIQRADVVETPMHDHASEQDKRTGPWTAALLHARRPAG